MFLGFNSGNPAARTAAVMLAAAAFALGIVAATAVRPMSRGEVAAAPALAPPPRSTPEAMPASMAGYPADVVRVLDGDTFEARVRVWPGLEITTKVRLRGIDAPELRARCAEERVKAEAARGALSTILAQGRVAISQVGLDKFGGRVLAEASARGTANIAETLLAGGHVRRYAGGRREGWCGGRAS